jgi:hypothetical protein
MVSGGGFQPRPKARRASAGDIILFGGGRGATGALALYENRSYQVIGNHGNVRGLP